MGYIAFFNFRYYAFETHFFFNLGLSSELEILRIVTDQTDFDTQSKQESEIIKLET
jgi:hypothetical protein